MVRLDKYLADAGIGTRSEVKGIIRKGRVSVNGTTVRSADQKVDPKKDQVEADGQVIGAAPEFVYYLLNKPAGYISATEDRREKTVLELLPEDRRRNLFPVGRLDKDTEGLLLVTDDGVLAHELLAPGKHVDKVYDVKVDLPVDEKILKDFRTGIDIGDEKLTLPAEYEILSSTEILLTIHEGRFHQVKRMMEAVGRKVIYLKRLSMGEISLPEDLEIGNYLTLSREQILPSVKLTEKSKS